MLMSSDFKKKLSLKGGHLEPFLSSERLRHTLNISAYVGKNVPKITQSYTRLTKIVLFKCILAKNIFIEDSCYIHLMVWVNLTYAIIAELSPRR